MEDSTSPRHRNSNYGWEDRGNGRNYFAKVAESGRLLGFMCTDRDGFILHELQVADDGRYLETPNLPALNDSTGPRDAPLDVHYRLGEAKIDFARNSKLEVDKELTRMSKTKMIWYKFEDHLNDRTYNIGFSSDGDLVGYLTSRISDNKILHQIVPSYDSSQYDHEEYELVGKFSLARSGKAARQQAENLPEEGVIIEDK